MSLVPGAGALPGFEMIAGDVMRRLALTLAIGLACLAMAVTSPAQDQRRRALGGDRLRILYWPSQRDLAEIALTEGEAALRRLESLLDVQTEARVEVYIVRSYAEFDELTGQRNKPWTLGIAMLSRRPYRVVIKPLGPQRLPGLLTHELAHVMLDARMGEAAGRIPRWLHEGVAQFAAGPLTEDQRRVIANAALADKLLTIDELDAAFQGNRERVALAYAESYTLVAYLSDQKPAEGVGGLLDQIKRGREVRLALGLAYGRPVPLMEEEWLESIQRSSLGAGLPPFGDILVGVGFVVSFLLALAVVRRRSRAIRRRMTEQQLYDTLLGEQEFGDEDTHETGDDLLD